MSHFYGTLEGNRGKATRAGTKHSGMITYCASWNGAICCRAYVNARGADCVIVGKVPWQGKGVEEILYDGPIGK